MTLTPRATEAVGFENAIPKNDELSLEDWSREHEDEISKLASKPLKDLNLTDLIR
jgi:hypothetical protein